MGFTRRKRFRTFAQEEASPAMLGRCFRRLLQLNNFAFAGGKTRMFLMQNHALQPFEKYASPIENNNHGG
jgi:hypothetical protein